MSQSETDHAAAPVAQETGTLAGALEREHREIDEGLDAYSADPVSGRQALARAIGALRRHIYLEEAFLFPPLREAGLVAPVIVMLREHGEIWASLDELERDVAAGGTGYEVQRRLAVQLLHHNLKEERILYPQADEALSASAAGKLRTFLESGEIPAGWVCQRAPA